MCGSASHLEGGEAVEEEIPQPKQSKMKIFEDKFATGAHTWRAPDVPGGRDYQTEIDKVNARIAQLQELIDQHQPEDGTQPQSPRNQGTFVKKRFEPDLRSNSWNARDGMRQRTAELHTKYNRELQSWQKLQQRELAKNGSG